MNDWIRGIQLMPQPKRLRRSGSVFEIPPRGTIAISDQSLYETAEEVLSVFPRHDIAAASPLIDSVVSLAVSKHLAEEEYRLKIARGGVVIEGGSGSGVFWAVQTLLQIAGQCPRGKLPCITIDDVPDFQNRGVYLDVSRGRVPTLESLMQLAAHLAKYKINQLQIYIEHTFKFRGHPSIGRGATPLTAEEILELDRFCRDRHIELVPSFASFGHMTNILKHPEYHHLCEDLGRGKYSDPEVNKNARARAWSVAPANPDVYGFLDSLFAELLPLFSSNKFNACCDETWDLCQGESYELGQRIGKGRVYVNHIRKLSTLSRKYGKKLQIWGDVVRGYPELISELPRGVTLLDWNYSSAHDFSSVRDFQNAGRPFYACPGTSGWRCLFPRLHESMANITGFASAAKKSCAQGVLTTDWGDGGHYNFMEYSWYGYLMGAEQSWNVRADSKSFAHRFSRLFLGSDDARLVKAIVELGDIAHLEIPWFYQAVWQHIFFGLPDDKLFAGEELDAWTAEQGVIKATRVILDAKLGRDLVKRLAYVRRVFVHVAEDASDPVGVLPYWIFAVDTIAHAAKKLTVLGPGGRDTATNRRGLRSDMKSLMRRFERLWMARNKRSEMRTTVARYRKTIASLG